MVKVGNKENRAGLRRAPVYLVLAGTMALSGCSWTPDWANPVEWYRGTRDWVAGDDTDSQRKAASASQPASASGQSYPKLASVPQRPAAPSEADRKAMAGSLAADRDSARYTDEQIRLQAETVTRAPAAANPAPQTATVAVPATPPAPRVAAAPPAPVQSQPIASVPAAPPPPAIASPRPAPQPMPQQLASAQPAPPALRPVPPALRPVQQALTSGINLQPDRFVNASRFSTRFPAGVGNTAVSAPAPAPAAVPAAPMATVYFGSGSSQVSTKALEEIRRAAGVVKRSGARVVVVGHASSRTRNLDPLSHQIANFRVSYDRAQAVARALIRQGVDRQAIEVSAVSDSQPVFFEVMPAGEAGNRRVEIILAN